ncbi:MAG: hypothetical protein ACYCWW_00700, partial [Deltaproteobacteria bacterium]
MTETLRVRQLDLFEDRTLRLQRARRALLDGFDIDLARDELCRFEAAQGDDPEAQRLLDEVERLEAAAGDGGDALATLLRLEAVVPPWLRPGWHRRLAVEAERRLGAGCRVGDEPAGHHLLRAGDLEAAERSLSATLAREPGDAR